MAGWVVCSCALCPAQSAPLSLENGLGTRSLTPLWAPLPEVRSAVYRPGVMGVSPCCWAKCAADEDAIVTAAGERWRDGERIQRVGAKPPASCRDPATEGCEPIFPPLCF